MKPVTCYLERLSVCLYPSLEEFEEELLDLLNSDRLLQVLLVQLRGGKPDARAVMLVLHLWVEWKGSANGVCFA